MFVIEVIAGRKYNRGFHAYKLMLEVLPRVHWRKFESCFFSEHANSMETLKKLEDSP